MASEMWLALAAAANLLMLLMNLSAWRLNRRMARYYIEQSVRLSLLIEANRTHPDGTP